MGFPPRVMSGSRCLLVGLLLAACTEPTPTAEVGTGVEAWEPFVDDIVYLVEGAQGGRHVIGNVRMTGMDPGTKMSDAPATRFDLFRDDGTRVSEDIPPFHQAYVELPDGQFSLPFGRIVFVATAAAEILDTTIEIKVEITDQSGRTAGDSRWVTVKPYVP